MEHKLGEITLDELFGGYELVNKPASHLPQDVASAVGIVNGGLLGATYQPIFYVGKQAVNGMNHMLICEEIRTTKNRSKAIVALIINIPPGEGAARGENARVVRIIEEADMPENVQAIFSAAEKQLAGVSYKPVAYIGSQVVKGVNHYFVCEARVIYPGAEPRAVIMGVNVFDGNISIVGIAPVSSTEASGPLGYAFTW